jgi:hypothetical protein
MTPASLLCSELMKEGYTGKAIANRLGLTEDGTFTLIRAIDPNYNGTVSDTTPYGLTFQTYRLRQRFSRYLQELTEELKGDRLEVGRVVGLNRRQQLNALRRPHTHDWTLSQIERLADAISYTFEEIMNVEYEKEDG